MQRILNHLNPYISSSLRKIIDQRYIIFGLDVVVLGMAKQRCRIDPPLFIQQELEAPYKQLMFKITEHFNMLQIMVDFTYTDDERKKRQGDHPILSEKFIKILTACNEEKARIHKSFLNRILLCADPMKVSNEFLFSNVQNFLQLLKDIENARVKAQFERLERLRSRLNSFRKVLFESKRSLDETKGMISKNNSDIQTLLVRGKRFETFLLLDAQIHKILESIQNRFISEVEAMNSDEKLTTEA